MNGLLDAKIADVLTVADNSKTRGHSMKLFRSQGMPESKLHVIFVALIISRIFYALSSWSGFLNSQQINRINAFLRKAHPFGLCSPTCLCDVSEYLRLVDSILIAYKVLLTACHICFHQKSITLAYVLEVTVHSLYVQISPDAYFVFSN